MSKPLIDLTGKRFNRLVVIKRSYPNKKDGHAMWLCRCDCGTEKIIQGCNLKGKTKSCGCLRKEGNRKFSPGVASMRQLISKYKRRAKMRGYNFELTEKQFFTLTQKDCFYCGIKPNNIGKSLSNYGEYVYNGIDRVDNTKGYTMENTVPCCKTCNYAKNNLSLQEFKEWVKRIYNTMFLLRNKGENHE